MLSAPYGGAGLKVENVVGFQDAGGVDGDEGLWVHHSGRHLGEDLCRERDFTLKFLR